MAKLIIVGKGPAGISAALYTARAKIPTLIIGRDGGALAKTDRIENYYGFAEPVSGTELLEAGIANAKRLGAEILEDEVVGISWDEQFTVRTKSGSYIADAVLLATGAARSAPAIPGLKEYEGRGVSYCAVCDAFFYREKEVAVLGSGEYALHEALELVHTARRVTLLTNGEKLSAALPEQIHLDTRPLTRLTGEDVLTGAEFQTGDPLAFAGLFVAVGVASSSDLAKKLGASVEQNRIVAQPDGSTDLPGLFAAGDCRGGLLQIAKAVSEGALAGTAAIQYIRKLPISVGNAEGQMAFF